MTVTSITGAPLPCYFDDDDSPVIGTICRPLTMNEALYRWRLKGVDKSTKEVVGRALAKWILEGGDPEPFLDVHERHNFGAWCEMHAISGVAKAMRQASRRRLQVEAK